MNTKCTNCGSDSFRKSRVRPHENKLKKFFLRPIRCRVCGGRQWILNSKFFYTVAAVLLMIIAPFSIDRLLENTEINTASSANDFAELPHYLANHKQSGSIQPDHSKQQAENKNAAVSDHNPPPNQYIHQLNPDPLTGSSENRQMLIQLYHDRALNGHADAQYQLGLLYLTGRHTLQDFEEAAKWLKLSAEQDYALAQYELGILYLDGLAFSVDLEKSYKWLNLAAAAGIDKAILARENVTRKLSNEQLLRAQKEAREWLHNRENEIN
ncbi:hypothetical protein SAMN05216302_100361 [Nitrosomonas aestuarii]|uniref:Sel1 repeat-containing protein n=1 Tax=Nitrosomonas aestuarii TaxID=52441 RepID=A0A1I3Y8Q7_9PROT|nr:tetratricopeptide repeat protein [Nitrosomonas aestuarii]SFK27651.1 hypothetical protein SAMN05216302_100361 [Nitrosomonas aestuarii]